MTGLVRLRDNELDTTLDVEKGDEIKVLFCNLTWMVETGRFAKMDFRA